MRAEGIDREVREAVRRTQRAGFRIVHYSVQSDHVHMIVEADDNESLSRGMKSFAVSVAMRVNGVLRRRRGKVWAERYHRRDLLSPTQVRNTLVYVLSNHLSQPNSLTQNVAPRARLARRLQVHPPRRSPPRRPVAVVQ
jgi:REP element-mobilizing transposase RayT